MWLIAAPAEAPCQCFSPGGGQTTSPATIARPGPPQAWTNPRPAVTISVCPHGCVCHALRAPGSNDTQAHDIRDGCEPLKRGATVTWPVNQSAGPVLAGSDALCLTSMVAPSLVCSVD